METIKYNGKEIGLDYTEDYSEMIRHPIKVTSFSRGKSEDFPRIEKEAQQYLVKHALGRRSNDYKLNMIAGIKQIGESIKFDGDIGIKLSLEGFAVFKRK